MRIIETSSEDVAQKIYNSVTSERRTMKQSYKEQFRRNNRQVEEGEEIFHQMFKMNTLLGAKCSF